MGDPPQPPEPLTIDEIATGTEVRLEHIELGVEAGITADRGWMIQRHGRDSARIPPAFRRKDPLFLGLIGKRN